MEYGLTPCDTVTAQILFAWVEDRPSGNESGIDEAMLGWKRLVWECDEHVISLHGAVIIPGGDEDDHPGLRYGRWGAQAEVLYSRGFDFIKCRRGFVDLGVGYLAYFGYPSDQLIANARLGVDVIWDFQILGTLELDYGLGVGKTRPTAFSTGITGASEYRLLKGALLARYEVNECFSILAGYFRHVWGRQVGTGGGFQGGIWWLF